MTNDFVLSQVFKFFGSVVIFIYTGFICSLFGMQEETVYVLFSGTYQMIFLFVMNLLLFCLYGLFKKKTLLDGFTVALIYGMILSIITNHLTVKKGFLVNIFDYLDVSFLGAVAFYLFSSVFWFWGEQLREIKIFK